MGAGAVMRTVVDAVIVADRLPTPRRGVAKAGLRARVHHRLVPQLALGRDEGQLLALLPTPLWVALAGAGGADAVVLAVGVGRARARGPSGSHG